MHDPMTVAFEIRRPWPKSTTLLKNGDVHKYYPSIITVWHVDPERHPEGGHGNRTDDSCGWFTPPTTAAQRERIRKIGEEQYSTIFERRCRTQQKASYADICFEPTPYDAVYWAWRRIAHEYRRRAVWQYDKAPTRGELDAIYQLATCPVDNLQLFVKNVNNPETCAEFFYLVHRAYLRHHRPRWRHPRWHIHHWRIQIHLWQTFRRWWLSRCAGCGGRFAWGESPVSFQWDKPRPRFLKSEVGSYHSACANVQVAATRPDPS